jgi:clan AA aspartic protease
MITGVVNADREAIIRLKIKGTNGQEQEIDAVVDTGFNGFLTLPLSIIVALDCAYLCQGYVVLADGRMEETEIYETFVDWDGQWIGVETDAADSVPLVGMALMYGYDLNIQAVDGGTVTLKRM